MALLVLVLAHLWIEHFMHPGRAITYGSVARRLVQGLYQAVDYWLLVVVVYHGLNGLKNVLEDRPWRPWAWRGIIAGLWIVGLATLVLGGDILSSFLDRRAWFYL